MTPIVLEIEGQRLVGELFDTPAAQGIAALLPSDLQLTRWGEEYYGRIGSIAGPFPGEQIEEMAIGDLAYWEPGNAFCIFFGATPASRGGEPRAASPVHRVGSVTGDWAKLKALGRTAKGRLFIHP